jgi:hypothetical protein
MPAIKDIETASAIVKQFYPNAANPVLEDLLEDSKSATNGYRPYIVSAYLIYTEYRRILKAEDVTFDYNTKFTIEGLINLQKAKDCGDETIDPCWTTDKILEQINTEIATTDFSTPSVFVI